MGVNPLDWKYKHFAQEAVLQAQPEAVMQAAGEFLAEALASWKISDTAEGLEAKGRCAGHKATAKFHIEPASGGSKLVVTLLVERAGPLGFMLFDVGGFYDHQINHWLKGIQTYLQHGPTSASAQESAELRKQAVAQSRRGERLLLGCIATSVLFLAAVYAIAALIGLLTGSLYLPGRGSDDITMHGRWARVVSALILLLFGWIAFRIWRSKKRNRGSGWLPPPSR
jgi:hypothetical protein